ncbi:MAG: adenosylcobinamide-GDP ribazoletransferase [Faecalibacterium sp.]
MDFLTSFCICFAMYSILPMPTMDWTQKKMRFCFCFFPLIGVVIGAATLVVYLLLQPIFTPAFTAVILLLMPICISGGIHLDGLIDSCDAFFSFGDKQKKLDILKDPRTGAFGVIGAVIYCLLLFASYYQIVTNDRFICLLSFVFVISRCVGALCMLYLKNARTNGLGATFSDASDRVNVFALWFFLCLAWVGVLLLHPFLGLALLCCTAVFLALYLPYIKREFGGITGDLTGFIITALELILPFAIAIGGAL